MTAKALHKKIACIGLYEDKDIEKSNPSRRARENIDASKVIQEGIDNPVNDPSLDIWPDDSEESLHDYRNEKALDDLGFAYPRADVKWTTRPSLQNDFQQFMGMTEKQKREYLDEAYKPSTNPFTIFYSKDALLSDSNHVFLSFVSEFSAGNATVSVDILDTTPYNTHNDVND
tara:strand:+ start:65475 stop:65993 length:519 start_codon:yes stop_codon:yes gene_type:complete